MQLYLSFVCIVYAKNCHALESMRVQSPTTSVFIYKATSAHKYALPYRLLQFNFIDFQVDRVRAILHCHRMCVCMYTTLFNSLKIIPIEIKNKELRFNLPQLDISSVQTKWVICDLYDFIFKYTILLVYKVLQIYMFRTAFRLVRRNRFLSNLKNILYSFSV